MHPANFISYDAHGNCEVTVQAGLECCGYKAGTFLKKDDVVCTIDSVTSDGALSVRNVDRMWKPSPGSAWSISNDDIKFWRRIDPPEDVEGGTSCVDANSRLTKVATSIIVLSVNELLRQYPPPAVRLQCKPRSGVFCKKDYKVGALVMVYASNQVQIIEQTDVKDGDVICNATPPIIAAHVCKLAPQCTTEYQCETWRVGYTDQEANANMQLEHRTIEVHAGAPNARSKKHNKTVSVPVLVNVMELSAGDELLVFRPKAEKKRPVDERSKGWADVERVAKAPRRCGGGCEYTRDHR